MNTIRESLGISNADTSLYSKLYRITKKASEQTHIKDNVPIVSGYNYMADILHLPTDKFGYNKLLVVVDIATDAFDIEKMKGETGDESLVAFDRIIKRGIVKFPYTSILTDGGSGSKVISINFYMNAVCIIE